MKRLCGGVLAHERVDHRVTQLPRRAVKSAGNPMAGFALQARTNSAAMGIECDHTPPAKGRPLACTG
jgi:hypothetical protein